MRELPPRSTSKWQCGPVDMPVEPTRPSTCPAWMSCPTDAMIAEAVAFLDRFDNVAATVTLHHLMITLDDVAGGLLQPDLFCKPIAKTPRDREALRRAIKDGTIVVPSTIEEAKVWKAA